MHYPNSQRKSICRHPRCHSSYTKEPEIFSAPPNPKSLWVTPGSIIHHLDA